MSISNPHAKGKSCSTLNRTACFGVTALFASLFAAHAHAAPDWSDESTLLATTREDDDVVATLKAKIEGDSLFVLVDTARTGDYYNLFFDTDGDAKSGYKSPDWPAYSGAEYVTTGGSRYTYDLAVDAKGIDWNGFLSKSKPAVPAAPTPVASSLGEAGRALQFEVSLADIGARAESETGIGVGFEWLVKAQGSGATVPSIKVPARQAFARLTPADATPYDVDHCRYAAPSSRPAAPVLNCSGDTPLPNLTSVPFETGRGVIIPAYLPADSSEWQRITGARSSLTERTESRTDYWVVLNGPNNGPPETDAEWKAAEKNWTNVIGTDGARAFGYVHACPEGKCLKSSVLRSQGDILQSIADWVCNYPKLSGIWLDEFYPQYELTTEINPKALVPQLDNAHVQTVAPIDRCFINYDGTYNDTAQILPDGGYFDQLIGLIHANFPGLKIIGNVGARLFTNLDEYGKIVDVLVSYEHSYDQVLSGENALKTVPGVKKQLALIHGTSDTQYEAAIDRAFRAGFSHVWATDQKYVDTNSNPYGSAPSYIEREVNYVFNPPLEEAP